MAVWNCYWRRFRNLVSWQNQRTVRPENGIWWSVSILLGSYRGDFWRVRSEGFLRERLYINAATELQSLKQGVHKYQLPRRCVKREVFEDINNGRNLKTFFISGSSGLLVTRRAIWQEELTSLTARVSIHLILLQIIKDGKRHMISLIQSIRHKMWHLDDTSMQHHLDSRSS